MIPERQSRNALVASKLMRDYMGWWAYLMVMGGLASAIGPYAPDGSLLIDQPQRPMPGQLLLRDIFPDVVLPRDGLVG
jgi:hypothetical protein